MNFKKYIDTNAQTFQMAPMLDIIFILLIQFMVATIFAQWENKLEIKIPTADAAVRQERQSGEVIINIDEGGDIYINSILVSEERLLNLLMQISEEFQTKPAIIRADENTKHRDLIKVLDICKQADVWNIAFSTLPKEQKP